MPDDLRPLLRNAVDVLPSREELERRVAQARAESRPLRVKLGLDPTAVSVTLGWSVVLSKLRAFQDAGHLPVLIIGDFTARVGDPSGRSKTRPMLTPEQIDANAKDYLEQFGRIIHLDGERLELRRNSEWLGALGTGGLLELAARSTLARMLERDDFAKRYRANEPISLQELMYPLLQGWDSVNIDADIEIGGTDQTFNLLVGRDLQEQMGQRPQIVMTHELLVGTDGTQKMSQSLGNYVGLTDSADDMYGKTMSIPDAAMPQWFRLASGLDEDAVAATIAALDGGELEPVEGKRRLARAIAARYHGEEAAEAAAERFRAVFGRREVPTDAPEHALAAGETVHLPALLVDAFGLPSRSEARRRLAEGAVRIDGEQLRELDVARSEVAGRTLQVGRRFVRLVER